MASINFAADPNLPTNTYDVLPKGDYLAMVIASELKPNKKGTGEYLQLTFEVIDGPFKGRKIFDRLNVRNANKTAEKIAMESLNALCLAAGVLHLTDSEQLHNLPVTLAVDIEPGNAGYSDQNRVKGYRAPGSAPAAAPAPVARVASPSTAAAGNTPVWKKKPVAA